MVETATFSIFNRVPPKPAPAPPSAGPPAAAFAPAPPEPTDARTRRRAARALFQQLAPPPASPAPAPRAGSALETSLAATMQMIEAAVAEIDGAPSRPPPRPAPGAWTQRRQPEAHRMSLALEYQLLGLASPSAFEVAGTVGDAAPVRLSIGRTGLYRPEDARPALWGGFASDTSPDRRTGLVAGTRILTARGEVAVEQLVPGDAALTLRGPALLPILWIGRSLAAEPPIRVDADAFGPGQPRKPLILGAEHAVFVDANPVPARQLVNGQSIRPLGRPGAELFHIDVGAPEVLLAEGVPLASGRR